jgi:hypothetical protein
MFPTNPVEAMANGEMLQIIVFALLFGYAVAKAGAPGARGRSGPVCVRPDCGKFYILVICIQLRSPEEKKRTWAVTNFASSQDFGWSTRCDGNAAGERRGQESEVLE